MVNEVTDEKYPRIARKLMEPTTAGKYYTSKAGIAGKNANNNMEIESS